MRGNMVINRSDAKKRKKEGEMLDNSLPDSPKRTKVHAQRKFAQGSSLSSPTMTPVKDKDKSKSNGSVSSSELIPSKRPKTEDFLTFLCLRGTPILPPRLDFFNLASVPDGQDEEQVPPMPEASKESLRNKTVPLHSNSKLTNVSVPIPKSSPKLPVKVTEKKTDSCDVSSSGVNRKNDKTESKESIVRNGNGVNKRSTNAVQALKKKYQEQRLAKQRGNTLSKLVQIVKEKSMMRTRSSTTTESIHLTGKSQPVVKLEKLSKSKILRKTSVKSSVSPKKEQSTKKEEISPRSANAIQRVTRSIVLSKESHPNTSPNANSSNSKGMAKGNSGLAKRNSLRSRGSLHLVNEEIVPTRRSVARQALNEKQSAKPSKESSKSQESSSDKKLPKSKPHIKVPGKEFASSLSDFSSDDDQPLVKKASKISIQNVRRTKLVKKALKRIVMKNRKPSRMMTRSQLHRPVATANRRNSQRPTRKTKEAATMFMELIGKKWTTPEEDNADDDLVSLINYPDLRKSNKQGKGENENKMKNSNESLKKEVFFKEKTKSVSKVEVSKKTLDTKEKSKDGDKDDKEKKNSKDKLPNSKAFTSKQNKPTISQRELILKEKMRRNPGKVICNKTAHSKCMASRVVERKVITSKDKIIANKVQTRNRSLRSDSSDEVSKKQANIEMDVVPEETENKTKSYRMTRRSFKGIEEPNAAAATPKVTHESKEEPRSKPSETSDVSMRSRTRTLRKVATKNNTFQLQSNSSQSEEKFSDSDEEPLGRKLIKSLRQSIGANKSVPDKKDVKAEMVDKYKEVVKKSDDKGREANKKSDDKSKEIAKKIDNKSKDAIKKGDEKQKEVNKKGDEKLKETTRKIDEKSKELSKKIDEKVKESSKKVDDKLKEASKKVDEKSKELGKKVDEKTKEPSKKVDEKSKETSKKGDEKLKETGKKSEEKIKEVGKKGDEKIKEIGKRAEEKSKEVLKKGGEDKIKDTNKKSEEKIKDASKKDSEKAKEVAKKGDDKPKELTRRTSVNLRNSEEEAEVETHERSTRARSSKISLSSAESSKLAKSFVGDVIGEKSPKSTVLEGSKEFDISRSAVNKRIGSSSPGQASEDVPKRVTRNDKPSKSNEPIGKVEEKSTKKKITGDSGGENSKKSASLTRGKTKELHGLAKEDTEHGVTKLEAKRPIDSTIADGIHLNETGQSDSKKIKVSAGIVSPKVISQISSKMSEEHSVGKTQPKLSFTEKFLSMGSKVDEALKSMKKDAICPLISDTETPVELVKVDSSPRKKSTGSSILPKKEQSKLAPQKKSSVSSELAARHREPVEVRCDKMCEKSKLFSIEKQAHGGLVLVKKTPVGESDEDSPLASKTTESQNQTSPYLGISPRKYDLVASGLNTSLTVPNIPFTGRSICTCKPWVTISEKPSTSTTLLCPLHGELANSDPINSLKEQKIKDIDSPSKDSKKSSDDAANAESVHNASAFGTDVDSFNDIECADSEVRRKVSKTVEEIEKWLLVSDIINSGKIPEDKDKPGDSDLQANRIEFDNIRASMLDNKPINMVESDVDNKEKKQTLNKQVQKTLESCEKGIGIPLETFYNRVSQKNKYSDSLQTTKFKEDKVSDTISASQTNLKLTETCDIQLQKGEKTPIVKNKSDSSKATAVPSKVEEKVTKPEQENSHELSPLVITIYDKPSPPKGKLETKRSPAKDRVVGASGSTKKTSALRNFRMKPEGRLKAIKEDKSSLLSKSSSSTLGSPVKCSQSPNKNISNEQKQTASVGTSIDSSTSSDAASSTKSDTPKNQRSSGDRLILTSVPDKKPILLKGGNNFTVRKPKERVVRRTPSVGAFSPENESSVYAFETEDREAPPTSTPFRRKTKDGRTNTSPSKQHHRHSSSSSESSSFVCSDIASPGHKSVSSDIIQSSKSVTPENSICGLDGHLDTSKNPTASIAIQVNLDESLSQNAKSPPISVPIYIPSSSREIGLSTSASSPLVLIPETRSTECSTQTDSGEGNGKIDGDSIEASVSQKAPHTSEGHLFYIPLRPTSMVNQTSGIGSPSTSIATNQLIRGVAVKLGTEGPTGPNQRVIMHAELVTDPPQFAPSIQCQTGTITTTSEMQEMKGTSFSSATTRSSVQHLHPSVVNLPSDPKHMCHPSILPISVVGPASQPLLTQSQSSLPRPIVPPPVGTVQPTTRPRPLSSGDGTTCKSPTSCVSSTQTDNVKSDLVRSGPSSVSEQPAKAVKVPPKSKENATVASHVSPGPSSSKASTSSTKRSQQKCKSRASAASVANEMIGSSSNNTPSTSSVSLTNHPNPMANFPSGTSARMVEAPTFHPTEKEFQDPLEFIERIRPIAEKFGLCRVVPPPNFKPDCQVSDDMRFTAYNQYVHKMQHRWGPNVKEMMVIKKYLRTQSISFTHPPWIGGMEIDLPRLYQTVQSFGGLKEVIEKKKWQRVADGMRIPKLAQDRVTKLDDIYCKYLLPYDTLSPDERQKLFDDIEKEWGDRENQPLNLEGQGNDDDSEGDGSDEFDECIVKGRSMALNAFYRIARNTMAMWFKQPEPSANDVESEYWRHVTGRTNHVCVHSGSIDSSVWGYGFPCTKGSPLARHPWNLKVFTNNSGSILRSMGPVMGVTVPTLHVGMLFTTCCWYRDPHGLPWVEYLHTGASKIWYGIPHSQRDAFRAAMTKLVPRYCKNKTIWLPSDTAMVPPNLLVKHGVSLCRTVQEPGQFILVFPRAFTSSICTGYLVSESVYFSQPGWLSTAEEVFKDIQDSCEPPMFSLERFLFRIATDTKSHVDVLKQVLPMIFRIRENELERRKQLSALGLKSCERLPQQPTKRNRKGPRSQHDDDGDYECEVCRANLYVSLEIFETNDQQVNNMYHFISIQARIAMEDKQKVTDSNEECVYCLQHAIELLTKKKNHVKYCKLLYTYDQNELNDMIQKLLEKIETKTQKKSQSKHGAFSR